MPGWSSLFGTVLVFGIYLSILTGILLTDQLAPVPKPTRQRGLNLTQAWADLHTIASLPHPYNSHANDRVHAYLLSRLAPVAAEFPGHVHLVDDAVSNGTWENTYFEGTNILVKIDGTDENAEDDGAVLFSAHYDSVSTSTGTTDDGMAVATLLQLVHKYARTRPRRTAVFNFNNGEEDHLNGAHAFLQHPWSNLTSTFINLEGAASGGRPLLFRSTSPTPLSAYLPPHVPHPHTNVLAANAFARGLIRSQTDYVVYAGAGEHTMQGLDISFYKGRSRYHTRYDSVPWLEGGERALWAMMETADGAGWALLNRGGEEEAKGAGDAVYFDLFGRTVILFSLTALRVFDVVFLITAPILMLILSFFTRLSATTSTPRGEGLIHRLWSAQPKHGLWWLRFWVALLLTVAAQAGLAWVYARFNPYIVYSSPYLVLLSALSLAYATFAIPLAFRFPAFSFSFPFLHTSTTSPKTSTASSPRLLPLFVLTYALLLTTTLLTRHAPLGGTYPLSALAACVFAGWVVGAVEELALGPRAEEAGGAEWEEEGEEEGERRMVTGVRFEVPEPGTENGTGNGTGTGIGSSQARSPDFQSRSPDQQAQTENGIEIREGEEETEPTEITPLIAQHGRVHPPTRSRTQDHKIVRTLVWVLQLLLVVPLPVMLFAHVGVMVVGSMGQGVGDGGKGGVVIVYTVFSLLAIFFLLPVVPFLPSPSTSLSSLPPPTQTQTSTAKQPAHHNPLIPLSLLTFALTLAYTSSLLGTLLTPLSLPAARLGFPFTVNAPLKIFFEQNVEVLGARWESSSSSAQNPNVTAEVKALTILRGVSYYLERMVVPALPSAVRAAADGEGGVECVDDEDRVGLKRCWWASGTGMYPQPGSEDGWDSYPEWNEKNTTYLSRNPWLKSSVTRLEEGKVRIRLQGRNSRACRVYFESPTSSSSVKVKKWSVVNGSGEGTTDLVRLWSRTWGREFVLDVEVEGGRVGGRVACEWVEYASGMTRNDVGVVGGEHEGMLERGKGSRIPAYEEALKFFPRWAVPTKVADGLVEVWAAFEV
ncbi:Vacuolar membrane protease [Hypsizygus marmoreus]|uniref:Peptide hydrolase n=1 Tax=Hypsizygus marmoreus TaxID=39966 RepID=A0A369JY44_HYPMA|nr:Vacuolar membrane protease [Hypsizygus marmoreus]